MRISKFPFILLCILSIYSCHRHRNVSKTTVPVFDTLQRVDYFITNDTTFEVQVKSYGGFLYPYQKPAPGVTEWNNPMKNSLMIRVGHFKISAVGLATGFLLSAVSTSFIQNAGGQKTKTVSSTILGFAIGTKTVNDGYKIPTAAAIVPGLALGFTLNNYLFSPKHKAKKMARIQLLQTYQVDYLLNTRYKISTHGNLLYRSATVEIKSKGIKIITDSIPLLPPR